MLDAVEPQQQGEVLFRPFLAGRLEPRVGETAVGVDKIDPGGPLAAVFPGGLPLLLGRLQVVQRQLVQARPARRRRPDARPRATACLVAGNHPLGIDERAGLECLVGGMPVELGEQPEVRVTPHQCPQPLRRFAVDAHQLVQLTDRGELGNEVHLLQGLLDLLGERPPSP